MKESDLYLPIKQFLESKHYEVKGEVGDCDLVAIKDEEIIIIEFKLQLNIDVLLQTIDRLQFSPYVYVGIPTGLRIVKKKRKLILRLFKMLGLGLIEINPNAQNTKYAQAGNNITVHLEPSQYKPRIVKRKKSTLLQEFWNRVGDPNLGGTDSRQRIITAYRQRVIKLACVLHTNGPMKASNIAKETAETKTLNILYKNYYGWFERMGGGVYKLTEIGEKAIQAWNAQDV